MRETLIIFLQNNAAIAPNWVVLGADNQVKETICAGDPAALAELAIDKQVIAIVPAEEVLLTYVIMPKMNRSRLMEALPFALEEQLVEDVESLHFAVGETQADGKLPVAVVAKKRIQQWMQQLQSYGVQPDQLIPLTFALPITADTWTAVNSDVITVRTGEYTGFVCDHANANILLTAALASADVKPATLSIISQTTIANALQIKDINIDESLYALNALIAECAQQAVKTPHLNLLQGMFRSKKSAFPYKGNAWRLLTYSLAAWIGLLILYPFISYCLLASRASELENEIAAIYQKHFPNGGSLASAQDKMQSKLQSLTSQTGDGRLFVMIGYIGKAVAGTPTIKLKQLTFQDNRLTLEVSAASSDDFSKFNDFLTNEGLQVKQQHADLAGSRINATIVVE